MPYYKGHEGLKKENNGNWKGGKYISNGYDFILLPQHPRASSKGYIAEHIVIAEKAFGRPLPTKAVVHHHTKQQLVVCENQAYHRLLHARQRISILGGSPSKDKICNHCGGLKPKESFHRKHSTWDGRYYQCSSCRQTLRRD